MLPTLQLAILQLVSGRSDSAAVVLLLIVCPLIAFAVRSYVLRNEGRRVDAAVQARLGQLICRSYDPSGGGWAARRNRRIYRVIYQDAEGHIRLARGCTVHAAWVRFYGDRIIGWHRLPAAVAQCDH